MEHAHNIDKIVSETSAWVKIRSGLAMADERRDERKMTDVKQSFAWGQLSVGTVMGGFALYQLALKMTSTPPTEILLGLLASYEAVRNFLLLPFDLVRWGLSVDEKNSLTTTLILLGALLRAVGQAKESLLLPVLLIIASIPIAVAWTEGLSIAFTFFFPAPALTYPESNRFFWLLAVTFLTTVVVPALSLFARDAQEKVYLMLRSRLGRRGKSESGFHRTLAIQTRFNRFVLLNVLFMTGSTISLLLLNWATS